MNRSDRTNNKIMKARGIGGFMSGVLVLSVSTVIVKVIGLGVKIPLLSVLGAGGMGYFNSAVEIYALLCVIATAGLPTAMSMVIASERERGNPLGVKQAYKTAMTSFLILGATGSGAMLLFARPIAAAIGNPDAYFCILAISPSLLMICVASAVRGYFQGFGYMSPTAVSQLIEALGKLIFGVWLGSVAVNMGMPLPIAAGMAVLGLTVGTLLSAAYLLAVKGIQGKKYEEGLSVPKSTEGMSARLLRIAFPITLSAAVIGSCRIVDMTLILRRLQSAGMSAQSANVIYGSYATLAVPVFSLIPSLVTPISLSLVPTLCSAVEGNDRAGQTEVITKSLRLTVLLSMPASMGIALYAKPILSILFSGEGEAVNIAAPLLAVLSASVMFSSLITTTNAVLQSYKKTVIPIISMGVGTAVKIILAYTLIGIPAIGAYGAPVSTLVCDMTVTLINLAVIGKKTHGVGNIDMGAVFAKPLAASLCAMLVSAAVYMGVMNFISKDQRIAFCIALVITVLAYIAFAFLFGALDRNDISDLKLGKKSKGRNK